MPPAAPRTSKRRAETYRQPRAARGAFRLARNAPGRLRRFLKKQTQAYSSDLKRCQRKFTGEAVHRVRVRARRLLSLLRLLAPFLDARRRRETEASLKMQLDRFKRLRDVQVQLPVVRRMRPQFAAADAFYRHLAKSERRWLRKSRRAVQAAKIKPLTRALEKLRAQVKEAEAACAPETAARMLAHVVQDAYSRTLRLRKAIIASDTKTIHRTRIAFKRFRYMVEAMAHSVGPADRRRLTALHDYQAAMGSIQDVEVLLRAFAKFQAREHPDAADARRFRQALIRRRNARVRRYLAQADRLLAFRPTFPTIRATKTVAHHAPLSP
jgi:CHAD domain-containing protein